MALIAFLLFQLIPRQIISIFGDGTEKYFQFGVNYFKIYLFFTFVNFLQSITSTFFSAIGKPKTGMFLSLTRQILFLLLCLFLLPRLFGLGMDGIMYSGPIADFLTAIATVVLIIKEFRLKEYKAHPSKHNI